MAELIFTCNQQQKRNDNNYFKFNIFLCFDLWSISISYKCSIHTYIAWYTLEEWQLPNNQSSHFLVHKGEVDKGITTLTLLPVLRQSADPSRAITGDDCWAGQVLAAPTPVDSTLTEHWLGTRVEQRAARDPPQDNHTAWVLSTVNRNGQWTWVDIMYESPSRTESKANFVYFV